MKSEILRKKEKENSNIMAKIWSEYENKPLTTKEDQIKEFEKNQNCNTVDGKY